MKIIQLSEDDDEDAEYFQDDSYDDDDSIKENIVFPSSSLKQLANINESSRLAENVIPYNLKLYSCF